MEFKIVYQSVPYNYTQARVLVLAAETPEEAFVMAYDRLTRQGLDVYTLPSYDIPMLDAAKITTLGVPYDGRSGTTHVRSIEPYRIGVGVAS